jgi:hypothetical protein
MVAEALALVAVVLDSLCASEVGRLPGAQAGRGAYSGGGCDFRGVRGGRGGGCNRELKNGLSCRLVHCRCSKS